MPAKFCATDGCFEVAIGAARSREHCRKCYLTTILAHVELVRFEVTAAGAKITDARTQVGMGQGSTVELDPLETNVAALVAAGFGKVVVSKAQPAKAATKPDAGA